MPYATEVHISAHFSAWAAKLMASQQLADIVGLATQTLRASAWSFVRLQTIAIQCIDAHKEVQHDLSWRENMWLSCDHVTDGMLWCQYWTNQTDGSWRLYRGDKKCWCLDSLSNSLNVPTFSIAEGCYFHESNANTGWTTIRTMKKKMEEPEDSNRFSSWKITYQLDGDYGSLARYTFLADAQGCATQALTNIRTVRMWQSCTSFDGAVASVSRCFMMFHASVWSLQFPLNIDTMQWRQFSLKLCNSGF